MLRSALAHLRRAPTAGAVLGQGIGAPGGYLHRYNFFHTSRCLRDLMEFFDHPDHWGAEKVRVGRHWKKDELRLKSNEDLHKLWFVLLKERNMLLTMQEAYQEAVLQMPNEERLDKVDMSMENLEEVVRERNRAYYELEVGGSGEQEREIVMGPFGLDQGYVQSEHPMPFWQNPEHQRRLKASHRTNFHHRNVMMFYRRYREKMYKRIIKRKNMQLWKAAKTLKRFPNTKPEALEEVFDEVTYDEVIRYTHSMGNHPNTHLDAPTLSKEVKGQEGKPPFY